MHPLKGHIQWILLLSGILYTEIKFVAPSIMNVVLLYNIFCI